MASGLSFARILFLVSALMLVIACGRPQIPIGNTYVCAIGHGGSGLWSIFNRYPTNSPRSIYRALSNTEIHGIEVDIQMTADGHLVLFHDEKLSGVTNCKGQVINHTLAELTQCRYRKLFESKGRHEGIMPLAALLDTMKRIDDRPLLFLDVKRFRDGDRYSYDSLLVTEIALVIHQHEASDYIFVEGDLEVIKGLKSIDDDIPVLLKAAEFNDGMVLISRYEGDGMTIQNEAVTSEQVAVARKQGKMVVIRAVRATARIYDALSKEADMIYSDRPKKLIRIIKREQRHAGS